MGVHDPLLWPRPESRRSAPRRWTARDIKWRLCGIAAFAIAAGVAALHHAGAGAARHGALSAGAFALGLFGFAFASLGLLLLLHGARLFDDHRGRLRAVRRPVQRDSWPGVESRETVAWMLAERAIAAAAKPPREHFPRYDMTPPTG